MEFNVNWCRITSKNFDLGFTKIRDILRPGEDPSRDSGHRPRNMGRPGKYGTVGNPSHSPRHCINDDIATRDFCTSVRAVAQNSLPIYSN